MYANYNRRSVRGLGYYDRGRLAGPLVSSSSDPRIDAQNVAGAELAAVVSEANARKDSGTLDPGSIQALRDRALAAASTFVAGPHTTNGGKEITALASQIASDVSRMAPSPGAPAPVPFVSAPPTPGYVPDIILQPESGGFLDIIGGAAGKVLREVTGGGGGVWAGPVPANPYPVFQAAPASGLPDWLLPAALGVGLVYLATR